MEPIPQVPFPHPHPPPPPPATAYVTAPNMVPVAPTPTPTVVPTMITTEAAAALNHIAHHVSAPAPVPVPAPAPPNISQTLNHNHAAAAAAPHNHNHNHPPYAEMIYAAIAALKERNGSSRRAIAKYIERVYSDLPPTHSALLTHNLKRLKNTGHLVMVKKSYKLPRSDPAAATSTSLPSIPGPPKAQAQAQAQSRPRGRPPKPKLDTNNTTAPISHSQPIPQQQQPIQQQQPNAQPVLVALGLVDEPNVKRRPGRPRKSGPEGQSGPGPNVKKGRGRPPVPLGMKNMARLGKKTPGRPPKPKSVTGVLGPNGLKRGRGRPPKAQLKTMVIPFANNVAAAAVPTPVAVAPGTGQGAELPEGCLSEVFSLTSPKDACRACAVSPICCRAAESNVVWERFLPSNYKAIIARSSSPDILNLPSKKQIYLSLSDNPILIDDSKKSFFLDKSSGKKCYLLAARELCIIWSGSPQYWNWISLPESRFPEVAELLDVCWLDICGKMSTSMLSPNTNYAAYLVYKLTEGAYGFDRIPPTVSVGTTEEGEVCKQTVFLGQPAVEPNQQDQIVPPQRLQHTSPPSQRKDGWLEIKLGECFNEEGKDYELQIRLLEGESRRWKRGLIVEGIEIRPTKGAGQDQ